MVKLIEPANPAPEKNVRQTAQALKQHFLEMAEPLVEAYVNAALGNSNLQSTNSSAREEVWSVLKQMMLQSSDKLEIDIASAEGVLEAVSTGKCTFEEGEKLLSLYKKVKDIEVAGNLPGNASVLIQILNATGTPINQSKTECIIEGATSEIVEIEEKSE